MIVQVVLGTSTLGSGIMKFTLTRV